MMPSSGSVLEPHDCVRKEAMKIVFDRNNTKSIIKKSHIVWTNKAEYFERKMEEMENRYRLRKAIERA